VVYPFDDAVLAASGVNYDLFKLFAGNDEPIFLLLHPLPSSSSTTDRRGFFSTAAKTPGNQTAGEMDLKSDV
jgi:hypothetical protein